MSIEPGFVRLHLTLSSDGLRVAKTQVECGLSAMSAMSGLINGTTIYPPWLLESPHQQVAGITVLLFEAR